MPVSWGSANVLSKDEQIAYCSMALIPLLSKRQAELWRKYYSKGRFWQGNGWSMGTDITICKLLSEPVSSLVRIYGWTKLTIDCAWRLSAQQILPELMIEEIMFTSMF